MPNYPLCIVTGSSVIVLANINFFSEFCDRGSLWGYLRRESDIPLESKLLILRGIASGMLHLHMEGIVHRDLAARNILVRLSIKT